MELPIQHIGCNGTCQSLTCVRRRITPEGSGLHGIRTHQTLNPVKTEVEALSQNIMPDPSCPIDPVTGHEALSHDS